jgi:putative transposase
MKRARFADEQIVRILQEAYQSSVVEVAKRHGVSEPSIYALRMKFGDLGTDDVKRLKQLEQENNPLKKILTERDLEIEVMKEIATKKWWEYRGVSSKLGMRCVEV